MLFVSSLGLKPLLHSVLPVLQRRHKGRMEGMMLCARECHAVTAVRLGFI